MSSTSTIEDYSLLGPYRVLDLCDEGRQFAGYWLGLLGAEVVLVEKKDGTELNAAGDRERFSDVRTAFGRGKRSVALDLANTEDADLFGRLVRSADIVLMNDINEYAGFGFDPESMQRLNPSLVVVTMTPFGLSGPKASYAATDLTMWAASGAMGSVGRPDRAPVRNTIPQSWCFAGAAGAAGALAALLQRTRSGIGQRVEVSAQESTSLASQSAVLGALVGARTPKRADVDVLSLRLGYPAKDGYVSITHNFGDVIGAFTARLMRWVYDEGFCAEEMRDKDWVNFALLVDSGAETVDSWEKSKEIVAALTATKTKEEMFRVAQERRLVIAPVNDVNEVLALPHFLERQVWDEVVGAAGKRLRLPRAGCGLRRTIAPAPYVGADDPNVLLERRSAPVEVGDSGDADPPLAGLKVLDLSWAVAGPMATRMLVDAGATVIKVESPHKIDPARSAGPHRHDAATAETSAIHFNQGAGKLAISLDLNEPASREVALRMVEWADVVLETYSPRAMRAWHLTYDDLRTVNPDLIMMSSSLFGQTGPLADFAGFGNLAAAMCGFSHTTGWEDDEPIFPAAYTDYVVPPLIFSTLVAAVDYKRRTGKGIYIDFAQAEASLHFLAPALVSAQRTGVSPMRMGNSDPVMSPHVVVRTAGQDAWVAIACESDVEWTALVGVLGVPALSSLGLSERREQADAIEALIARWAADRSAEEVTARLQAVGVPSHPVYSADGYAADRHLHERGHFLQLPHEEFDSVPAEAARWRLSRTPFAVSRGAPTMNQDLYEVVVDLLGFSLDEFSDLAAAGVFG